MKILFFSDLHLHLTRTAHTTPKSAALLRQQLFSSAQKVLEMGADMRVCLGDLFDTYSNPEVGLRQGAEVIQRSDIVMAGNHDIRNSAASVSSLQLLSGLIPGKVVCNSWDDTEPTYLDAGKSRLVFVPHVSSQEGFEKALLEAANLARNSLKWNVLCLHCNIGMEGRELSDTTLNLSSEMAERMLTIFHHIVAGHEHNPRDLYGGRLRVIGNLHPTGFSDISDKRVVFYDTEEGSSETHPIWEMEGECWKGPSSGVPNEKYSFLDLEDDQPPGEAFKSVSKMFSGAASPFCIRLASSGSIKPSETKATLEEVEKLPDLIASSIERDHPELIDLWKEVKDAATLKNK